MLLFLFETIIYDILDIYALLSFYLWKLPIHIRNDDISKMHDNEIQENSHWVYPRFLNNPSP